MGLTATDSRVTTERWVRCAHQCCDREIPESRALDAQRACGLAYCSVCRLQLGRWKPAGWQTPNGFAMEAEAAGFGLYNLYLVRQTDCEVFIGSGITLARALYNARHKAGLIAVG